MTPSVRTIIELNIRYYRDLLKAETDLSKRKVIAELLADEEGKLAKLASQDVSQPAKRPGGEAES